MNKHKIIIPIIICIFLVPIILFAISYFKSDKFKLRELYSYISDDYKPYFEYDEVTIDKTNKLCDIEFKNKMRTKDDFVKQTSIVVNKVNEFIHKNPNYLISDYHIEIWFNFKPGGELFELRNYDINNNICDNFIYLYKSMNGIKLSSVANYYPNIKYLAYFNWTDDDYKALKLFSHLEYVNLACEMNDPIKEQFSKDYPYIKFMN